MTYDTFAMHNDCTAKKILVNAIAYNKICKNNSFLVKNAINLSAIFEYNFVVKHGNGYDLVIITW